MKARIPRYPNVNVTNQCHRAVCTDGDIINYMSKN